MDINTFALITYPSPYPHRSKIKTNGTKEDVIRLLEELMSFLSKQESDDSHASDRSEYHIEIRPKIFEYKSDTGNRNITNAVLLDILLRLDSLKIISV